MSVCRHELVGSTPNPMAIPTLLGEHQPKRYFIKFIDPSSKHRNDLTNGTLLTWIMPSSMPDLLLLADLAWWHWRRRQLLG